MRYYDFVLILIPYFSQQHLWPAPYTGLVVVPCTQGPFLCFLNADGRKVGRVAAFSFRAGGADEGGAWMRSSPGTSGGQLWWGTQLYLVTWPPEVLWGLNIRTSMQVLAAAGILSQGIPTH